MDKPVLVIELGEVLSIMIKAPPAFLAEKRSLRCHFRAIPDETAFHSAHQVVWIRSAELVYFLRGSDKIVEAAVKPMSRFRIPASRPIALRDLFPVRRGIGAGSVFRWCVRFCQSRLLSLEPDGSFSRKRVH